MTESVVKWSTLHTWFDFVKVSLGLTAVLAFTVGLFCNHCLALKLRIIFEVFFIVVSSGFESKFQKAFFSSREGKICRFPSAALQ